MRHNIVFEPDTVLRRTLRWLRTDFNWALVIVILAITYFSLRMTVLR